MDTSRLEVPKIRCSGCKELMRGTVHEINIYEPDQPFRISGVLPEPFVRHKTIVCGHGILDMSFLYSPI
jgi:hypothetical protein